MPITHKQLYAMKKANEQRILASNSKVPHQSGIYILTREAKFCYVGQSVDMLERLASHLSGYQQHIDLSLKTHKLYSADNAQGWKISFITCPHNELDVKEREFIQKAIDNGYGMYNITSGGQGAGKVDITERRATKGYRKGVEAGYKKASKEIANLFEKHLNADVKKPNKNTEKAMQKFQKFLDYYKDESED